MIRSVRLKNFRRYEDEAFTLGPGINFVEGENNAGKTSILYAIEYALFGRVEGFKSPAALMRPGARGLGVELVFVGRNGERYRLQRVHRYAPRARTKLNGNFTLKALGPDVPVAEDEVLPERYVLCSDFQDHEEALALELAHLTGLSRRLFQVAVHMRQGEIARILEGAPELDIVLGVTAAVVGADELRGEALEMEKDAAALPAMEASQARYVDDRARVYADLEAAGRESAVVEVELARIDALAVTVERDEAACAPLVGAHRALVAADAACAEAQRRLDEHDEHAHEVRARGDREGLTARLAGAEARRAAIATEREALRGELASADHDRQTLARSSGDLTGRIERRERTAEAAGANCEACGAPIDAEHAAREIADWRRELAVVDDRLHMLAASSAAGASRLDELAHEDGDLAGSVAETRRAIEELEALDGRRGQRQAAWAASTDVRGACASSAMAAVAAWSGAALSVDPDDLATSLGLAIASIERAVAGQRGRLDAERAAAEHRRDRAEDERADLIDRLSSLDRDLAGLRVDIERLRTGAHKAARLRSLAQAFKELQGVLRERASGALAVDAQGLHAQLSQGTDRPDEFESVIVDPMKYSVRVVPKQIGEEVPAALYEGGGHRLLLGLAFKLAVARLVGKVPFVMLDEPTYGLDERNRASLLDRITGLGVADQIVLITHETMGRVAGRRVRVTRDGLLSRIKEV